MKRQPLALLGIAVACAACIGSNPSTPPNYGKGPNYSSTPCFDNCGGNAACQANCTNSAETVPGLPLVEPGPFVPK